MGIQTKFSGSTHTAIDLRSMADEMFAEVVADHAADRFRTANRANRRVAGIDIDYTVSVDGRLVHRGRGDLFPDRQVSTIVRSGLPARRRYTVAVVDWLWHQVQPATLLRVIAAYGEIRSLSQMVSIVLSPRAALFRYLLLRYLKYRFPAVMARLGAIDDRIDEVKTLYRYFRMARLAGRVTGGSSADADALVWIARELRDRSPFLSGAYRDAHALYGDGRMLMPAADLTADAAVPDADEYSFTNTEPYSRKIEFGKTADGRDFVLQVPNRIYERIAEEARNRFRGVADIRYELRAVIGNTQTPQRAARRPHNQSDVRFPAIVVRF